MKSVERTDALQNKGALMFGCETGDRLTRYQEILSDLAEVY